MVQVLRGHKEMNPVFNNINLNESINELGVRSHLAKLAPGNLV